MKTEPYAKAPFFVGTLNVADKNNATLSGNLSEKGGFFDLYRIIYSMHKGCACNQCYSFSWGTKASPTHSKRGHIFQKKCRRLRHL